jgi:hypothetical protein
MAAVIDEAMAGGAEFGEDWTADTSLDEIKAVLEELGITEDMAG